MLRQSGRSAISTRNRIGPRIDPCLTPNLTSAKPDLVPLQSTHCFPPDRYESNHFSAVPAMPMAASFGRSNSLSTVSKAEDLNGNTLWITGGRLNDYSSTKSTEFVQLTGTTTGPDLPLELGEHCLVSLNDTTVILIGGYLADLSYSRATFYYNNDHQTWTEGPSLITKRGWHSFALFKSPLHDHTHTVIVTGGYNDDGYLASTEFLNVDSNSWTSGTQLSTIVVHS
jgi:hypothetical protein